MKIQVNKWGNSLAVRIPNSFAKQIDLKNGTEVEMNIQNDAIVLTKPKYTLDYLLENVTPEMCEGEIDWGPPVGKEIW